MLQTLAILLSLICLSGQLLQQQDLKGEPGRVLRQISDSTRAECEENLTSQVFKYGDQHCLDGSDETCMKIKRTFVEAIRKVALHYIDCESDHQHMLHSRSLVDSVTEITALQKDISLCAEEPVPSTSIKELCTKVYEALHTALVDAYNLIPSLSTVREKCPPSAFVLGAVFGRLYGELVHNERYSDGKQFPITAFAGDVGMSFRDGFILTSFIYQPYKCLRTAVRTRPGAHAISRTVRARSAAPSSN